MYLVEGAATGHVVHRLTGCATFACLSATGMLAVAKDVRQHYGDATAVVVCAERGGGHVQGVAAAAAVQGQLCEPPWAADDTGTDFDDYCRAYGDEAARDALQVWTLPDAAAAATLATATSAQLEWVKEVNKDFFVALSWGASAQAAVGRTTGAGIALVDEKTLRLATDNHPVPGHQGTPYRFWLKSPARRQYRKVAYDPDWLELDREKDKNLWAGYTVEPKAGDWSLMRNHIFTSIASGDAAVGQHIYNLLAEIVQHPGRACGVALVLQGPEGAGKGVLGNALVRLFGPHGYKSSDTRALTGEFTGHLENVSFFYADEMSWAGDHRLREKLWSAITDPTLDIHHKGRTPYIARNCLNFILTTNKEHAASISKNNRRLFMVSVSDQFEGIEDTDTKAIARAEYFDPLLHQLYAAGGLAAMLHDLLAVDPTGFNAAAFPRTAAMTRNVMDSLDALDAWILAELETGWADGKTWEKTTQYQQYRTYTSGYPVADTKFWRRLREVFGDPLPHTQPRLSKLDGGVAGAGVRGRQVKLPQIAHARASASKLWGFAVGG